MSIEVVDLRKGDRFVIVEPVTGTFGTADVALLNLSLSGLQISHPQPLRIGTRARLWFKRGDISAVVQAHVVWSHLAKSTSGAMAYQSGLKIDNVDPQYGAALNAMIRAGIIRQDADSMEKKHQRAIEREQLRQSKIRIIPSSEPPPS
ncbi:MAG TPA: PilZ domain-containing protein [Thermoanaerobaculia bacterium]|nr:PilZ domain-containing protein [Thermoanaerobaculia bacterium]